MFKIINQFFFIKDGLIRVRSGKTSWLPHMQAVSLVLIRERLKKQNFHSCKYFANDNVLILIEVHNLFKKKSSQN